MPTGLEAISHNLICLVSDIAPHRELAAEFPELVSIIDSSMSIESLASEIGVQLTTTCETQSQTAGSDIRKIHGGTIRSNVLEYY